MKLVKSFLLTLISAAFVFGLSACDKQQGQEQPEDKTPGRASDLLTLFYQTVEKQNGVNPREKVYIVAHRANTLRPSMREFPRILLNAFRWSSSQVLWI